MNKEKLKELAEANGLIKDDFFVLSFGSTKIPIITRTGIEKIQAKHKIEVTYTIEHLSDDHRRCIIKAIGTRRNEGVIRTVETYGEVTEKNCTQSYPIAIAEKRALSRVVLKLAGLYEEGIMGEVEAEDFKK